MKILAEVREHLRAHPECYCFIKTDVPTHINDTGCILGWVAYFNGLPSLLDAAKALGFHTCGGFDHFMFSFNMAGWTSCSEIVVQILENIDE